tara:strand:- start:813 stop:2564 length:1752 start_codon:yes stop_codon:yes gene_type:complete
LDTTGSNEQYPLVVNKEFEQLCRAEADQSTYRFDTWNNTKQSGGLKKHRVLTEQELNSKYVPLGFLTYLPHSDTPTLPVMEVRVVEDTPTKKSVTSTRKLFFVCLGKDTQSRLRVYDIKPQFTSTMLQCMTVRLPTDNEQVSINKLLQGLECAFKTTFSKECKMDSKLWLVKIRHQLSYDELATEQADVNCVSILLIPPLQNVSQQSNEAATNNWTYLKSLFNTPEDRFADVRAVRKLSKHIMQTVNTNGALETPNKSSAGSSTRITDANSQATLKSVVAATKPTIKSTTRVENCDGDEEEEEELSSDEDSNATNDDQDQDDDDDDDEIDVNDNASDSSESSDHSDTAKHKNKNKYKRKRNEVTQLQHKKSVRVAPTTVSSVSAPVPPPPSPKVATTEAIPAKPGTSIAQQSQSKTIMKSNVSVNFKLPARDAAASTSKASAVVQRSASVKPSSIAKRGFGNNSNLNLNAACDAVKQSCWSDKAGKLRLVDLLNRMHEAHFEAVSNNALHLECIELLVRFLAEKPDLATKRGADTHATLSSATHLKELHEHITMAVQDMNKYVHCLQLSNANGANSSKQTSGQ